MKEPKWLSAYTKAVAEFALDKITQEEFNKTLEKLQSEIPWWVNYFWRRFQ